MNVKSQASSCGLWRLVPVFFSSLWRYRLSSCASESRNVPLRAPEWTSLQYTTPHCSTLQRGGEVQHSAESALCGMQRRAMECDAKHVIV